MDQYFHICVKGQGRAEGADPPPPFMTSLSAPKKLSTGSTAKLGLAVQRVDGSVDIKPNGVELLHACAGEGVGGSVLQMFA